MVNEQLNSRQRWLQSTAHALRMLALNFPANECARTLSSSGWSSLESVYFPCQKSDGGAPCPGWNWTFRPEGMGPFETALCPCVKGRSLLLAPLLELAQVFQTEFQLNDPRLRQRLSSFALCSNETFMKMELLNLMHLAATHEFPAKCRTDWVAECLEMNLENSQLQALRWWARLVELNQLVDNEVFTILLGSGMEAVYQKGQHVAVGRVFQQIRIPENALVVLALNGHELETVGAHSNRNAWFEAFVTCLDESQLGLVLLARQPLMVSNEVVPRSRMTTESDFRWRSRAHSQDTPPPLEKVLKRGVWDRLVEALARGDYLLTNQYSSVLRN